jgi:ketosteroid isomerase-like protein
MSARSPEETHALLAEAFNNGDLDAFVQVYEEDAVLIVPPDEVLGNGREEIRRALEPTFALNPRPRWRSPRSSRATVWP